MVIHRTLLMLMLVATIVPGCATTWKTHTYTACHNDLGDNMQRSFFAMILALDDRKYSIESANLGTGEIKASYLGRQLNRFVPRMDDVSAWWNIQVEEGGDVLLNTVDGDIKRSQIRRLKGWSNKLEIIYQRYMCRDISYMRNKVTALGIRF